jgi:hypothetical protein
MTSAEAFLNRLVDYAGLFPPAALSLSSVVGNYYKYSTGRHEGMLGRLIIPATRLPEFVKVFEALFPDGIGKAFWKISALIPEVDAGHELFSKAFDAIAAFNEGFSFAVVDSVEGKLKRSDQILPTIEGIPNSLMAFLEIPSGGCTSLIRALSGDRRDGIFAKVRTGGVTADLIPPVHEVATFIAVCAEAGLGFKATAGLHHPVRGEHALTYDAAADRGIMHGFLNVFVAACLARVKGWSAGQLVEVLDCMDPDSFQLTDEAVVFAGERVLTDQVREVRSRFAISFGSCSFTEPVAEIQRPGWLTSAAAGQTP